MLKECAPGPSALPVTGDRDRNPGDDAKPYPEREVAKAIEEAGA